MQALLKRIAVGSLIGLAALAGASPHCRAAGTAAGLSALRAAYVAPQQEELFPVRQVATLSEVAVQYAQTDFDEFDADFKDVVSVGRAVAYSLILPGAGQWYVGEKRRAGIFLSVDAAAWGTWAYLRSVGAAKKDDHRNYARLHAGVDPEGKDDEFYRTITFFDSRDQYNEDRTTFRAAYPNTALWNWQWDSQASQDEYRHLRNQSNEAYNRAKFALSAAVVNRVVAAVDAWRLARGLNRQARMAATDWKVQLKPKFSMSNPGMRVSLTKRF